MTRTTRFPGSASPAAQESIRDTVRRLESAQKSNKGAPAYSVYVNRPLGRRFAALAYHAGLTPNVVTVISATFSAAGIASLAILEPSWLTGILVALLLSLGYALDAADGQLARLRGGGSLDGEWLDHVVDSAKVVSVHLAVLIMAARFDVGPAWWLAVPLIFTVVAVVSFFGQLLNDLLARSQGAPKADAGGGEASIVRALAKIPTDYGFLCVTFVLLGALPAFVGVYSLLALGSAGYLVLALPAWYRRMATLDKDATP